jgi:hypothetical protein
LFQEAEWSLILGLFAEMTVEPRLDISRLIFHAAQEEVIDGLTGGSERSEAIVGGDAADDGAAVGAAELAVVVLDHIVLGVLALVPCAEEGSRAAGGHPPGVGRSGEEGRKR